MNLYYSEFGDQKGPLMIFLHGGGVAGWMWEKQIQHFTDYHCIVPDLPEHGQSQSHLFSIRDSAEQLIRLIEEKSLGNKVIVIGFSLGAQVAIQMLSLKPHLIHYAMLNSALVKSIPFASWVPILMKATFPLIKNRMFSKFQAKSLYLTGHQFETYYKETSQLKLDTLLRAIKENGDFRIPEDFNQAQANMLVTVGEKEKRVMKQSAMTLVANNPHCKGVIIPGVGHGMSLAKPDSFNQLVRVWLEDGEVKDEYTFIN